VWLLDVHALPRLERGNRVLRVRGVIGGHEDQIDPWVVDDSLRIGRVVVGIKFLEERRCLLELRIHYAAKDRSVVLSQVVGDVRESEVAAAEDADVTSGALSALRGQRGERFRPVILPFDFDERAAKSVETDVSRRFADLEMEWLTSVVHGSYSARAAQPRQPHLGKRKHRSGGG
jgi:hypothetical protein